MCQSVNLPVCSPLMMPRKLGGPISTRDVNQSMRWQSWLGISDTSKGTKAKSASLSTIPHNSAHVRVRVPAGILGILLLDFGWYAADEAVVAELRDVRLATTYMYNVVVLAHVYNTSLHAYILLS